MDAPILTEKFVEKVVSSLVTDMPFLSNSIYWEFQDDYQCIFIRITVDNLPKDELNPTVTRVAQLLNDAMPQRVDGYSWVVGFKSGDEIIDSCFGGSSSLPSWGV